MLDSNTVVNAGLVTNLASTAKDQILNAQCHARRAKIETVEMDGETVSSDLRNKIKQIKLLRKLNQSQKH
jgi:hypothetical protein